METDPFLARAAKIREVIQLRAAFQVKINSGIVNKNSTI
jgi:hypothetical protein